MNAMPERWEVAEIGDLLNGIKAGKNLKCTERPPEAHERGVIKVSAVTWGFFDAQQSKTLPNDFRPDTDTSIKAGDFLFSRANTLELVGAVVITETSHPNLFLSDKVLRLDMEAAIKPWLLKLLRSPEGRRRLSEISSGNQLSMRNIGQAALKTVSVPIPPLPEQRRIVAKLDRFSARSAAARDHLACTTKLATRAKQAILDAAFVALTDNGCDTVPFSEVVEQSLNGISKRRGDFGEDTLVLRLADLRDGRFIGEDGRTIRLTNQEREKYLLTEGDLVFIRVNGSENLVGRVLRWRAAKEWCFCDHFIRFRLRTHMASSDFVSWFFATDKVRRGIERSFVSSAGQKTVSQKTLGRFILPLPSLEKQAEIVCHIEAAFARIDRMTEEACRAAHLLDRLDERLLAKAFRGELVSQDPDDEPAEALLTRIREARAAAPKARRGRRKNG